MATDRNPSRKQSRRAPAAGGSIVGGVLKVAAIGGIAWFAYSRLHGAFASEDPAAHDPRGHAAALAGPGENFSCDGRTRCTEMTSCAEAKYFLDHCPGVKMDGDHNGIPCERQWCRGR